MWRNRHVVTALLVAPILALIAYFAVDAMLSPDAEALVAGSSYPLKEHSNCRRAGGQCTLSNNDLRLELIVRRAAGRLEVHVRLNQQAELLLLAQLLESGQELGPYQLSSDITDEAKTHESYSASLDAPSDLRGLRLVAVVGGANFFAAPSAAFFGDER